MNNDSRPVVAVPIGDPAGIGPEIVMRALMDPSVHKAVDLRVIGEVAVLRRHAEACGLEVMISEEYISIPGQQSVPLIVVPSLVDQKWQFGEISAKTGLACYEYVCAGIELAMLGNVNAVVAAPHTEMSINQAGIHFKGYPDLVAQMTSTPLDRTFLMLMSPVYRVVNATLHFSLKEAVAILDKVLIVTALEATRDALVSLGIPDGRIGVCGLNPHAGEGGIMGTEEVDFIKAAVAKARVAGIRAEGPFSSDALFADRQYDAYLALYHDQGHIPVKVASPREASAITIGTPILFGSVAHGSALNIAGQGIASERALVQALKNLSNISKADT